MLDLRLFIFTGLESTHLDVVLRRNVDLSNDMISYAAWSIGIKIHWNIFSYINLLLHHDFYQFTGHSVPQIVKGLFATIQ